MLLGMVLLFLTVLVSTKAHAATVFLRSFGDIALREPSLPVPGQPAKFYSQTGPNPEWQIVQWDIPGGKLSPFARRVSRDTVTFTSRSPEASVIIIRSKVGELVQLSQDGRILPCTLTNGNPRESDLNIQPMARWAKAANPLLMPRTPLGDIAALRLEADVGLTFGRGTGWKSCKVNEGNADFAVVLTDPHRKPTQTLFYQIGLNNPCGLGSPARVHVCAAGTRAAYYFFKKNPFGVQDRLPLLGVPFIVSGSRRAIRLNLIDRLRQLIKAGPVGMDRDPAHWLLDGVYMGDGIWGNYRLTSDWYSINLLVTLR